MKHSTMCMLAIAALGLAVLPGCDSIRNAVGLIDALGPSSASASPASTSTSPTNDTTSNDATGDGSVAVETQAVTDQVESVPAVDATAATAPTHPNAAEKIIFDIRAGYVTAFLIPAGHYNKQTRCGTSGAPIAPLCSDATIVLSLRKADTAAKAALDAAEDIARNHPQMDASAAIAAAKGAIGAAETIITTYNIR